MFRKASMGSAMPGPLLAVSRTESNQITIFSLRQNTEQEIATIPVSSKQPFGLAFDRTGQWLCAACWTDGRIIAINLQSLKQEKSLLAPSLPAWATNRENTNEIWFSNERGGGVTILDTLTWNASNHIRTGTGPSDIAFTENGRTAWVTNEKDNNVSLIDGKMRRKMRDIPVGKVPQGMTTADGGKLILVANFGSNNISVLDARNGRELSQIAVGQGSLDVTTLSDPRSEHAWVTCYREGAVSVVNLRRQKEVQRIVTGGKPQGIEIHPDGGRVFVAVRERNEIVVLSTSVPATILRRIKLNGGPARMTIG